MKIKRLLLVIVCMCVVGPVIAVDWDNFKGEDYEEPAGGSFALLANPQDNIYGFSIGDGTWLKNTPVFGDYFLGFFNSKKEDAWYSDIGMTIRIMPHWQVAPFVGAGGSYNFSLSNLSGDKNSAVLQPGEFKDQGDSFWGGHTEAGVRVWTSENRMLFELMGRYTWTSLEGDRNFWLAGLSVGAGL